MGIEARCDECGGISGLQWVHARHVFLCRDRVKCEMDAVEHEASKRLLASHEERVARMRQAKKRLWDPLNLDNL